MPVVFPPVESASPEGLLAIGGQLDEQTLLSAYSQGIFPWPISFDSPMTWFSPDPRGVLYTDDFHLQKSFKKFLKKSNWTLRLNDSFEQVILGCANTSRKHEKGTWIDQRIIEGFTNLFNLGFAYSIGVFEGEDLIGGLYGVQIGRFVSGESMFHLKSNASKVALSGLMYFLKKHKINFLDTQMVTPIIENLGGQNISREVYLKELSKNISTELSREELFHQSFVESNQLLHLLDSP